jgi:hypothetical protein
MGEAKRRKAAGKLPTPVKTAMITKPVVDAFYITSGVDVPMPRPIGTAVYLVQSVWDYDHPEQMPMVCVLGPFDTREEAEDMERRFRAANTPEAMMARGIRMVQSPNIEPNIIKMAEDGARRMQHDIVPLIDMPQVPVIRQ